MLRHPINNYPTDSYISSNSLRTTYTLQKLSKEVDETYHPYNIHTYLNTIIIPRCIPIRIIS